MRADVFLKLSPLKVQLRRERKTRVEKKSKQMITVAFFISADGEKVGKL